MGKVKSDGGSSDYYQIHIVTDNGEFDCQTGDIIDALVGGNFDLGNIIKACRRVYLDSLGKGKEGTDMNYDANKIEYFAKRFAKRNSRKISG